jgi:hypothetical protein
MHNKELEELIDMKAHIESPTFQKFIVDPVKKELDKLKYSYDCDSLRELNVLKGKKQGLMFLLKELKRIETNYQNKLSEQD